MEWADRCRRSWRAAFTYAGEGEGDCQASGLMGIHMGDAVINCIFILFFASGILYILRSICGTEKLHNGSHQL